MGYEKELIALAAALITLLAALITVRQQSTKSTYKRNIIVSAACDKLGVVFVKVENCTRDTLPVRSVELLKDRTQFMSLFRNIFGFANRIAFSVIGWKVITHLPVDVNSNGKVIIYAEADSTAINFVEVFNRKLMRPLVKVGVGRYEIFCNIQYQKELIMAGAEKAY